jgi:hypothetical protein
MGQTTQFVPADQRAIILPGVPADNTYTFEVKAFRRVHKDISPNGVLMSGTALSTPYRPTVTPAFNGDIIGTIQGRNSLSVVQNLEAIASDAVLSTTEKPGLVIEYNRAIDQQAKLDARAGSLGGLQTLRDAANAARTALDNYLNSLTPAWNDTAQHTPIDQAIFQARWATYYAAISDLAASISGQPGANGLNSATVFLYRRATSLPALPTTTSTYTFATGALTGQNNGWTQAVPTGTDPLYVTTATAVGSGTTDTIAPSEWAAATVLAQNGTNGAAGLNNARVLIYRRSATQPALPSVSTTFTFSTGALSGLNNSWTTTVPAANGNPLWVSAATASSSTDTDAIAANEWASPTIMAQDGTNGFSSAAVFIYKRQAVAPTDTPANGATYTFTTGVLTGTLNGWTTSVPAANGHPLWVRQASASSAGTTDTIDAAEWSAVQQLAADGIDGVSGGNTAVVFIYARAATAPAAPTASTTYTFTTGVLSGTLGNGWTQSIPAANGSPLWVRTAVAFSTETTDSIAANEWSGAQQLATDGAAGTAGLNNATVFLYRRSATVPAVPSVTSTYTFSTGVLTGQNNSWAQSVPSGIDPLYVITAAAVSNTTTDTILSTEWSAPTVLSQNGTSGVDGLNNARVLIYRRSATSPALPTAATTYTFSTGALTGLDNGWTTAVPTSDGNPLWVSAATASSTGTTDSIAAAEWVTPTIMAQNGVAGLSSAAVFIYKRQATAPADAPANGATYTFATGALTGTLNGWSTTVPATNGNPLWVRQASASSTGATDTIDATEWSAVQQLVADGTTGVDGGNTAVVFIYARAATAPAAPTGATTYTFATGVLTGTLGNGWTQAIPAANGQPLWVRTAVAFGTGTTDGIAAAEWSGAQQLAANGTNGTNGLNNARVLIYRRAATSPALPTATTTYTFATGGLTGLTNSWTTTVPAADGNPLWVSAATASGTATTDDILATEWITPTVMAQDGNAGAAGLNQATVFLYRRAASVPAVPSVTSTYTFATGVLTGQNNSWTQTVPTGTDPLYVTTAAAIATDATDTILTGEWSAPTILAQNGVDGTTGLNNATVFLYRRSASVPAVPSTTSTFTFSTGALTGQNNSWTQIVPSGTDPLYITTATAIGSGATDTIASTEWSAPSVLAQNGTAATNSARVFIYRRATSLPALPSVTTTYTFSTAALTGLNNSWTTTIPTGTDPLWVSAATAFGSGTTDTIAANEWAAPTVELDGPINLGGPLIVGQLPVANADLGLRNSELVPSIQTAAGMADWNFVSMRPFAVQDAAFDPNGRLFGERLAYVDGATIQSLRPFEFGSNVTENRTAAFIASQSPWATSTIPTARVNNLSDTGVFNSLANITTRNLNQLNSRAWTNLFLANGTTAVTDAAAVTSLGTAAFLNGQGDLATRNAATLPFGTNMVINSDFARGTFGWATDSATQIGFNLPNWHGRRNVLFITRSTLANGANVDVSPNTLWHNLGIANAARFAMPVVPGDRVYARALLAPHRCNARIFFLIFTRLGNLVEAPQSALGGQSLGAGNGENFGNPVEVVGNVTNADAAWAIPMIRMIGTGENDPYLFIGEVGMGKLAAGQTVLPPYTPGASDRLADVSAFISGPFSHTFNYTSTGILDPSNQMPRGFTYRYQTLNGPMTSGVVWQYRIISGGINGFTAGATLRAMSGSGDGTLTVSSLDTNTAEIEVIGTREGQTVTGRITLNKDFAAPNNTGGGGGGAAASASQSSNFAFINWNNTTFFAISNELVVTAATTTLTVNVNLSYWVGDYGSMSLEMVAERWNGSSWVSMGVTEARTTFRIFDWEMQTDITSPATFTFTRTLAVTAGTQQRVRLRARAAGGDAGVGAGGSGTLTVSA